MNLVVQLHRQIRVASSFHSILDDEHEPDDEPIDGSPHDEHDVRRPDDEHDEPHDTIHDVDDDGRQRMNLFQPKRNENRLHRSCRPK